jgi:PAS domain S-box-containing protein
VNPQKSAEPGFEGFRTDDLAAFRAALAVANTQANARESEAVAEVERWREMSIANRDAFAAMRNAINEHIPIQSDEADLLAGPEFSVSCEAVARAVIAEVARLRDLVEQCERKIARKDAVLAESEARFAAIFENAAIGISLIAPDGGVLAVNPMLQELSGRSEAELIALGGKAITYPEDRDVGRSEFAEVMAGQRNAYQVEKRYVHRDGRVHWMRQSISAVRDAAGKALYLVVIAEDIDERKRALEELRESQARFKAVFDNAAIGVAMMTLDRRIVEVNPTVTRITGYSPQEMFAINPSDMVVPEDRALDRDLLVEVLGDVGVVADRDQHRRHGEVVLLPAGHMFRDQGLLQIPEPQRRLKRLARRWAVSRQ